MHLSRFEDLLQENCRHESRTLALPESNDARILAAAHTMCSRQTVGKVWLFLTKADYDLRLQEVGLVPLKDETRLGFVPDTIKDIKEKTADHINKYFILKQKKISRDQLHLLAAKPLYQAGYLTASGLSDACLAGAVLTTGEVIRAALTTVGCEAGVSTVSGSFFMVKAEAPPGQELFLYSDCGVVIAPTPQQLVEIAVASVATWKAIATKPPVVAFLSFSTKGSAQHPQVEDVASAAAEFRKRCPLVLADGEMQFDAALDGAVGARKAPQSLIPGKVNIFIFPSLAAGNIAYKITQRLGGYDAYGPILQGLAKPFSDLSRGASVKDIVVSAYLNLLRSAKI